MLSFTDPVAVSAEQRGEFMEFAVEAAVRAGRETLPYFRTQSTSVENKLADGRFDPVTEADRAAEQVLREEIRRRYPSHGICGEEFGVEAGNGLTWVIDPIDGTRAFMSGMVHWGLLLGLFDGQRPVVGVMVQPYTEEVWCGDGHRAEFRRAGTSMPISTRQNVPLADAVVATTTPVLFEGVEGDGFARLESSAKLTRYGGDCYLYGMLAMGFVDVATDAGLNPYDIQGLIPIIEGAGGIVTTAQGGNASLGGTIIAAGSKALHEEVLERFNDAG